MFKDIVHKTVALSVIFFPFLLFAQSPLEIPSLDNEVIVDGEFALDEWEGAGATKLSYVTRPYENAQAPVETIVHYFTDIDTLYVVFIAKDPEVDQIRAFLRDRDRNFSDDLVGIKLDPYNDGRLAYQFFVNPLGVQADVIENEMNRSESESWNGIWESAGQINDQGYVVEMAIPLRLMNFVESEGKKTWGIEFVRFYPRKDNFRISHVTFDRDNSCNLCQMGEISGFENARQSENLSVVPTLVIGSSRTRDPEANSDWEYDSNVEPGLDVNWGITPELTLTGTLNPDFSQVESDVAQLSINDTFALFFPERRPFFVENADYFSTVQNLVYTRNIGAPDYGAKITGRLDNHSIGAFIANDESTTFLLPGNLGSSVASLDEESINLAARYRFDYSNALSLGTLATVRESDSYHNYLLSGDIRYLISSTDTLRMQYIVSETEYPENFFSEFCDDACDRIDNINEQTLRAAKNGPFTGYSYRIIYDRTTRDYFLRLRQNFDSEDFRADLGFVNSIDREFSLIGAGYRWWNDDSWWNRITVYTDFDITKNSNGELIEREGQIEFSIQGDLQSYFETGYVERTRVGLRQSDLLGGFIADPEFVFSDLSDEDLSSLISIDNRTSQFTEKSLYTFFEMRPTANIEFYAFVRIGDRIDFANNRLGDELRSELGFELNLGRHFTFTLDHEYNSLDADGQPLFDANLYDARLTYQFDPRQFVRLVISYSEIDRNPDNYLFSDVDRNSKNLGLQFLYSYKVNPLTKFFVGYSQGGFDNDNLSALTTSNQSVFLKFSYAWMPF